MAKGNVKAYWRDTARSARFFVVDSKAVFPFMLFFLHIRLWTFLVALVATIFFTLLERYGFRVPVFLRWLRTQISGPRKLAIPWWRE